MGEIVLMNRDTLLEKMREHYKNKDVKSLKRGLSLGAFFLLDEDKTKIQLAIQKLESEGLTDNERELIKKVNEMLV